MGELERGSWGVRVWGLCACAALLATGCGSSDTSTHGSCGTQSSPDEFEISNVTPPPGTSVPNNGVVQSFTIVGQLIELTPTFSEAMPAHTAGSPTPNPVHWTLTASGKDSVYTSEPITWATAPGHVELVIGGLFQNQTSHCVSQFPAQMFSYDVTAP